MRIFTVTLLSLFISGCAVEGVDLIYKWEAPLNFADPIMVSRHAKTDWPLSMDKKIRYKASKCRVRKELSNKILPVCYEVYEKFQDSCFLEKNNDKTLSNCYAVYNMSRFILNDNKMRVRVNKKIGELQETSSPDEVIKNLNIPTSKIGWLIVQELTDEPQISAFSTKVSHGKNHRFTINNYLTTKLQAGAKSLLDNHSSIKCVVYTISDHNLSIELSDVPVKCSNPYSKKTFNIKQIKDSSQLIDFAINKLGKMI